MLAGVKEVAYERKEEPMPQHMDYMQTQQQ